MSNLPATLGNISSRFANVEIANTAAAGIEGGYAIMKYKGKVWAIDYRGDHMPIMRPDGDGPANSIEVVLVDASANKSKIYYPNFVDGASEKPACFSNNGVTPDPRSIQKQANACAVCPMNQPGSKVDETGQARGKACRDSKAVVVVPVGDLENERFGGPMKLRVPAASLVDFAKYTQDLQRMGAPFCGVATKIAFDPAQAYPKFVFSATRALTDAEVDVVLKLRDDPQTKRILNEGADLTPASSEPAPNLGPISSKLAGIQMGAQPAPEAAPAPLSQQAKAKTPPKPVAQAAPKAPPAPVVAQEEEAAPFPMDDAATGTSLDDELEALLS